MPTRPGNRDVREFRRELCALLRSRVVRDLLDEVLSGDGDYDARPVYRALGERRMLVPHWPARYGGLDAPTATAEAVGEELALHGVPDSAYVNTVRNAGECIFEFGNDAQRDRHLMRIARGELGVAVLYSEPEAGSDLASLRTRAERVAGGWQLTGEKMYSVKTAWADAAICLARTRDGATKYAGLTLFLLPLDLAGISIERVDALNPEPFYLVRFDRAEVDDTCVLGAEGRGWRLLSSALALERTGLDYQAKAHAWLQSLLTRADREGAGLDPVVADRLVTLRTRIAAARALAGMADQELVGTWEGAPAGTAEVDATAMAKLLNSELGAEVAAFGLDLLSMDGLTLDSTKPTLDLHWQVREAPGLCLSAGSTEMMLRTIAAGLGM